jgi:hypothetical protein
MNVPSAKELQTELKNNFIKMHQAKLDYKSSVVRLGEVGVKLRVDSDYYFIFSLVVKTMKYYFDNVCNELTRVHAKGTTGQIKLNQKYYQFETINKGQTNDPDNKPLLSSSLCEELKLSDSKDNDSVSDLLERIADSIDFELIENLLKKEVATIYSDGLAEMANHLVSALNIGSDLWPPKIKGRFVLCQTTNIDHCYNKRKEYELMQRSLDIIASLSGINFGSAINIFTKEYIETRISGLIKSRTVFGKGENLEIHCFTSSIKFRFNYDAFIAVAEFVATNGNQTNKEKTLKLSEALLNTSNKKSSLA